MNKTIITLNFHIAPYVTYRAMAPIYIGWQSGGNFENFPKRSRVARVSCRNDFSKTFFAVCKIFKTSLSSVSIRRDESESILLKSCFEFIFELNFDWFSLFWFFIILLKGSGARLRSKVDGQQTIKQDGPKNHHWKGPSLDSELSNGLNSKSNNLAKL